MPRYIDADALIISLAKDLSALVNNYVPHGELHRIDETIWKVVEAPTADVVPVVRGEWIERAWRPTCSLCGFSESLVDTPISPFKYCPNCGAIMDKRRQT